jgi:hypothetical protein
MKKQVMVGLLVSSMPVTVNILLSDQLLWLFARSIAFTRQYLVFLSNNVIVES